jgi:hypothetical protein
MAVNYRCFEETGKKVGNNDSNRKQFLDSKGVKDYKNCLMDGQTHC